MNHRVHDDSSRTTAEDVSLYCRMVVDGMMAGASSAAEAGTAA